jgi:hypothetical protein
MSSSLPDFHRLILLLISNAKEMAGFTDMTDLFYFERMVARIHSPFFVDEFAHHHKPLRLAT